MDIDATSSRIYRSFTSNLSRTGTTHLQRLLSARAGVLTPTPIGIIPVTGGNILVMEAVQAVDRAPRRRRSMNMSQLYIAMSIAVRNARGLPAVPSANVTQVCHGPESPSCLGLLLSKILK